MVHANQCLSTTTDTTCLKRRTRQKTTKTSFPYEGNYASSFPPCKSVLRQKLGRARFVAHMWHAACNQMIVKQPETGWELCGRCYSLVWFAGPQMPDCYSWPRWCVNKWWYIGCWFRKSRKWEILGRLEVVSEKVMRWSTSGKIFEMHKDREKDTMEYYGGPMGTPHGIWCFFWDGFSPQVPLTTSPVYTTELKKWHMTITTRYWRYNCRICTLCKF